MQNLIFQGLFCYFLTSRPGVSFITIRVHTVDNTLGWSDWAIFAIFEKGHYATDQVYFYESNSKKSANLNARGKVFFYHRDHKNEYFFLKFCNYCNFLILQRTIAKKESSKYYFYIFGGAPKMGKLVFTWSK